MLHARKSYKDIQDPTGKIPKEEPVFLIRGQDLAGYAAVRGWIELTRMAGGDPAMLNMVKGHAKKMKAWPKKKVADLPPGDISVWDETDAASLILDSGITYTAQEAAAVFDMSEAAFQAEVRANAFPNEKHCYKAGDIFLFFINRIRNAAAERGHHG